MGGGDDMGQIEEAGLVREALSSDSWQGLSQYKSNTAGPFQSLHLQVAAGHQSWFVSHGVRPKRLKAPSLQLDASAPPCILPATASTRATAGCHGDGS